MVLQETTFEEVEFPILKIKYEFTMRNIAPSCGHKASNRKWQI